MRRLTSFGFVGVVGLAVDAVVLALLIGWTMLDPLLARLVSIGIALLVTWRLNRRFTFGASDRPMAVEGMRYGGIGMASSVINYLVYSAALLLVAGLHPLLALAVGSGVAMAFSYFGYSRLVFDRGSGPVSAPE
jgi:putative flippase GtrA